MYGEGKNLSAASASNISWTLLSDMRTLQNRNIYLAKKEILNKVFQTRSVDLVNTEILDKVFQNSEIYFVETKILDKVFRNIVMCIFCEDRYTRRVPQNRRVDLVKTEILKLRNQ